LILVKVVAQTYHFAKSEFRAALCLE
jgi:hypothetical protein